MVAILVLATLFSTALSSSIDLQWNTFKQNYKKSYKKDEEAYRRKIFTKNVNKITEHNKKFTAGLETYELGITEFADLTEQEFERNILSMTLELPNRRNLNNFYRKTSDNLPEKIDWREKGAVNVVRQQGFCGACYAFTAVGCIESQHYIKTGEMLSLSPQNIVDCSEANGNHRCKSGTVNKALDYVREKGVMLEKDYRYSGRNSKCRYDATKIALNISGYIWVEENEESLKDAVANVGPIGVSVDAREWQLYKSGILIAKNPFISNTHAVIVVGYGSENGTDYWLLKNTYGTQFGENGYLRIGRNMNNQFGVSSYPIYPTL